MQTTKTFKKIVGGGLAAATLAGVGVAAAAPAANASGVWDQLAQCESGGNWSINTGNGYYGGLQFSLQSWQAVGGSGYPHQASKQEQIHRAEKLQAIQGWGAWPACTASLGISGNPGTSTSSDAGSDEAPAEETQQEAPQQEEAPAEETQQEAPQQEEAPAQETQQEAPQQEEAPAQETQQEAPQQEEAPAQEEAPVQEEAPAPSSPSAQPNTAVEVSDETYTIEAGDSLSSIADALGIDDWQDLWGANVDGIDDPNLIFVGQELKLPVF
ncbi:MULTISPECIES: transglycosylase family protein [Actinomycetes]|uniref:LysM domain-containing protein n=2 Tax=Actinomycetes TaxID=1760 RepID=A0ABP6LR69_9MICC